MQLAAWIRPDIFTMPYELFLNSFRSQIEETGGWLEEKSIASKLLEIPFLSSEQRVP